MKSFQYRAFAALIIAAVLMFGGCGSQDHAKSWDELTVEQRYCSLEDGDNYYYADGGIYQLDKTLNRARCIFESDGAVRELFCIRDRWIYFTDREWNIRRVHTDSYKTEVLLNTAQFGAKEDYPLNYMDVSGDKLLFRVSIDLYCLDLNTKRCIPYTTTRGQSIFAITRCIIAAECTRFILPICKLCANPSFCKAISAGTKKRMRTSRI